MVMAAVSADVLVPRLEEKHDEPQEKKQKKTDEERQEEEDAPYREKVGLEKKQKKTDKEKQEEKEDVHYREKAGLPLDDELLSDDDDDDEDDDCFPGDLPEMTRAEYILYQQQVDESGVSNHRI